MSISPEQPQLNRPHACVLQQRTGPSAARAHPGWGSRRESMASNNVPRWLQGVRWQCQWGAPGPVVVVPTRPQDARRSRGVLCRCAPPEFVTIGEGQAPSCVAWRCRTAVAGGRRLVSSTAKRKDPVVPLTRGTIHTFFFLDHVQNKNHYAQCLFLTKGKKIISASLNFGPNLFFLPRPQNRLFRLLKLLKPFV